MGSVVDLAMALQRLVEALEVEVAECRQMVAQALPNSWQHKVCSAVLSEAERRLSMAEQMRRDWRDTPGPVDRAHPVSKLAELAPSNSTKLI